MDDWVKLATERHQMFEEQFKIKSHHRLDLSEYLNDQYKYKCCRINIQIYGIYKSEINYIINVSYECCYEISS